MRDGFGGKLHLGGVNQAQWLIREFNGGDAQLLRDGQFPDVRRQVVVVNAGVYVGFVVVRIYERVRDRFFERGRALVGFGPSVASRCSSRERPA